jgi:HD superfamily phosphohydrolase
MRLDGVKAFLCASLLHDVGHYPYAHSLKDLRVEAHERLTARLVLGPLANPIRSALGVEPRFVAAIIDSAGTAGGDPGLGVYARILSGALDPDKLDYLNRDAFFCGVPYGIQDVDFILEETYPHPLAGVSISRKGTTALEDVLFSKYLMYKTVYWHKTVRIATAMIKKAVSLGLAGGIIRKEDLYGLDDEEFGRLLSLEKDPSFRLIDDVRNRRLYRQALRVPFRDQSAWHRRLEDVGERHALEERIAAEAGGLAGRRFPGEWIIIDIPERVSFDMEIPVRDEEGASVPSRITADHLFAGQGSEDLPRSLRSISICARRDDALAGSLARMDLPRLLEEGG